MIIKQVGIQRAASKSMTCVKYLGHSFSDIEVFWDIDFVKIE